MCLFFSCRYRNTRCSRFCDQEQEATNLTPGDFLIRLFCITMHQVKSIELLFSLNPFTNKMNVAFYEYDANCQTLGFCSASGTPSGTETINLHYEISAHLSVSLHFHLRMCGPFYKHHQAIRRISGEWRC